MGKIILSRKKDIFAIFRSYTILVDNKNVANLYPNSTKEIELPSGEYSIKAKIDWLTSKTIKINIDDDSIGAKLNFRVNSNISILIIFILISIIIEIFFPNRFIKLGLIAIFPYLIYLMFFSSQKILIVDQKH
ncbi:MAG: hypothetical protein V3V14_06150 [Saprospiraceae bacterium]